MDQRLLLILAGALLLTGLALAEYSQGALSGLVLDQVRYNYTSKVWIPPTNPEASPTTPEGSSLGGYYQVEGQGRDFHLHLVLTGGETSEMPFDYTAEGLHATGHLSDIHFTPETIKNLVNHHYQEAILHTRFKCHMDMTCASWNGSTTFQNRISDFQGVFTITGVYNDWEGTYHIQEKNGRMVLTADYIYYPRGNKTPENIRTIKNSYYLS